MHLGIDRILSRGTGETIAELNNALLVRDNVSGAYFLACEDEKTGITLLDRYIGSDCRLLMVSDYAIGQTAFARYGFSEKLECYEFAYYGEKPVIDTKLSVRTADEHDLPMLIEHYQRISPEELSEVVRRGALLASSENILKEAWVFYMFFRITGEEALEPLFKPVSLPEPWKKALFHSVRSKKTIRNH